MAAAKKPTAQQKAQAKARAGGNNPIKVTKAGVKRLGKAALIAGSFTPAGRGVKAASMAVKAIKAGKTGASARALKAAQGPSLAKGAKKLQTTSGSVERRITKNQAETNMILGSSRKEAFAKAAQKFDTENAKDIAMSKKILARAAAEKKAKTISKALKSK